MGDEKRERRSSINSPGALVSHVRSQSEGGGWNSAEKTEQFGAIWIQSEWDKFVGEVKAMIGKSPEGDAVKEKALADIDAITAEKVRKGEFLPSDSGEGEHE